MIVEPIQGEGGIRVLPDACLKGLRDLCDADRRAADPRRGAMRHGPHRPALRA